MNIEHYLQGVRKMLYELALVWGVYALQTIILPVLCVLFSCLLLEVMYRLLFHHDSDVEVEQVDPGDDFWARLHHSAMLTGDLRPHDINPFNQDRPYVTTMVAPILLYRLPLRGLKFAYKTVSTLAWIFLYMVPCFVLRFEKDLIRQALRRAKYDLRQTLVFFNARERYDDFILYLTRAGYQVFVLLDDIFVQGRHRATIRRIMHVACTVVIGTVGVILIVAAAKAISQVNFSGIRPTIPEIKIPEIEIPEIKIPERKSEPQTLQTIDRTLGTEWFTPGVTTTSRITTNAHAFSEAERLASMKKMEHSTATTTPNEATVGIADDSQEEQDPETFTFFRNERPRINRVHAHTHKRTYCPTCKQWHCCEMASTANEVWRVQGS